MERIVATVLRDYRNSLYRLHSETLSGCTEIKVSPKVNVVTHTRDSMSNAALLHRRLGHFQPQGIKCMIFHRAVRGIPKLSINIISMSNMYTGETGT
jgi:hypothetical protein